MADTTTVTVNADYSQFYVMNIGDLPGELTDTYLAHNFESYGNLLLVAARQFGRIPVDVTVYEARPEALEMDWQDAVEVSIVAMPLTTVSGWMAEKGDLRPALEEGGAYRVRYAISSGDDAPANGDLVVERYRLDFWPEPASAAVVLRQESAFGRYWFDNWPQQ